MSKTYRNVKGKKVKEGLIKGKKRHSKYFRRKKSREYDLNGSISHVKGSKSGKGSNLNDQRLNALAVDERIFYEFKPLIE